MKHFNQTTLAFFIAGLLILFATGPESAFSENSNTDPSALYHTGIIDDIRSDTVIIGDVPYKLVTKTQYLSRSGKTIQQSYFIKGEKVKFIADTNYTMKILRKK